MSAYIGQPFPTNTLQAVAADGAVKPFSIKDAAGKWALVVFYPFSFTGVCGSELAALKRRVAEFDERGVQVVGVSCDSVHVQKQWIAKDFDGKLPFPLAGDYKKELASALGILHPDVGCSFRATFVVSPEGVIRGYAVNDLPIGRSTDEMLRLLDAYQSGGACLVDWKKG